MISVREADRLIRQALPAAPGTETVPLLKSPGRVLARDVVADRDQPPFDRVAMDGVALAWKDLGSDPVQALPLPLEGVQQAGRPPLTRPGSQTGTRSALEVTTGAVLPGGCDTVVPWEDLEQTIAGTTRQVEFRFRKAPGEGQNIHRQGSDYRRGDRLLESGTLISTGHIHLLASVGLDQVPVIRRARVALASTGDELVEVSQRPRDWEIRRSNTLAIAAEALTWGLEVHAQAHFPDTREALLGGLKDLLEASEVVVLTGGVSMGSFDLVPQTLKDLGCTEVFHKVAQKPGKPLWFGTGPRGQLVFGLPGNPVSSLFSFRRYVLPVLLAWEGRPVRVRSIPVDGLMAPRSGGTHFVPVCRTPEGHRVMEVQGSGNFYQLAGSAGFVEVPEDFTLGQKTDYWPWGLPGGGR